MISMTPCSRGNMFEQYKNSVFPTIKDEKIAKLRNIAEQRVEYKLIFS